MVRVSTARRLHYSYEEYLRSLENSQLKLEYCDGVIYAMAGGTPVHAELSAAMIQVLGRALPAGCKTYSSDLMIRVDASDLSTYPDVTVVCGAREVSKKDQNAVINPSVLVEVTSKSTADYDRGEKLSHYKQLPSLRAVLFVSHERQQVTLVERAANGWQETEFRAGERVLLAQPALSFEVNALFAGITLE
jgi:Uma2 family endonuclease